MFRGAANVKPVWAAMVFGTGIVVGLIVARTWPDAPAVTPVASSPVDQDTTPQSTENTRDRMLATPFPGSSAASNASANPLAGRSEPTATAVEIAPEHAGESRPIELGAAFRQHMAAQSAASIGDPFGDAHRALEREVRDDSWSYPLEAELQNSLMADVSSGNFTVEHVECRATACEIRLSGSAEQAEAIERWPDTIQAQPWGQRLVLSVSTSISNNGQVGRILILRKPPQLGTN
jgi:hypothetical protein